MDKFGVQLHLTKIKEAKQAWSLAQARFNSEVAAMMNLLLHEAAATFMSPEDVAKHSGFTVKRIRAMMRTAGLDPKSGKTLLSKKAATALATNADLLGIEPHEMDLMSPLAYLPMGDAMKRELRAARVDGVSGNPGQIVLTDDEFLLAQKLADAGPLEEEAVKWMQRVLFARGIR